MGFAQQTEQIAERVERMLVRYEELQRTNALLAVEVETLSQERDSLRSRLAAARSRVEALLDRLPEAADGDGVSIAPLSMRPPAGTNSSPAAL